VQHLEIKAKKPNLKQWIQLNTTISEDWSQSVKIGIVAKYLDNEDTYFSVIEALRASCWSQKINLEFDWVNAEKVEKESVRVLEKYDGILVPGGFGVRGVEGMIMAADYCLETGKSYLGLCLGLQVAVIASARRGGLKDATSAEIRPSSKKSVIYIMSDQKGKEETGGTMRLGEYKASLVSKSKVAGLYKNTKITERHRHRYEVNLKFRKQIEKGGLVISGQSPDGTLVEFIEARNHKFFVATQAHPEFKSRPTSPHPLFVGFIKSLKNK